MGHSEARLGSVSHRLATPRAAFRPDFFLEEIERVTFLVKTVAKKALPATRIALIATKNLNGGFYRQ